VKDSDTVKIKVSTTQVCCNLTVTKLKPIYGSPPEPCSNSSRRTKLCNALQDCEEVSQMVQQMEQSLNQEMKQTPSAKRTWRQRLRRLIRKQYLGSGKGGSGSGYGGIGGGP
jgi:hypothetical protein